MTNFAFAWKSNDINDITQLLFTIIHPTSYYFHHLCCTLLANAKLLRSPTEFLKERYIRHSPGEDVWFEVIYSTVIVHFCNLSPDQSSNIIHNFKSKFYGLSYTLTSIMREAIRKLKIQMLYVPFFHSWDKLYCPSNHSELCLPIH